MPARSPTCCQPFLRWNWGLTSNIYTLKTLNSTELSGSRPSCFPNETKRPFTVSGLIAANLLVAASCWAGNLYVPNFSFESPGTQFADPRIDSWQKAPQPSTFDPNTFASWDNLIGV